VSKHTREDQFDSSGDSTLVLRNLGNAESQNPRIIVEGPDYAASMRPTHLEVSRQDPGGHELIRVDTGAILHFGSPERGDGLEVTLNYVTSLEIDSALQRYAPLPQVDRPFFLDPRLRLPCRAALAVCSCWRGHRAGSRLETSDGWERCRLSDKPNQTEPPQPNVTSTTLAG